MVENCAVFLPIALEIMQSTPLTTYQELFYLLVNSRCCLRKWQFLKEKRPGKLHAKIFTTLRIASSSSSIENSSFYDIPTPGALAVEEKHIFVFMAIF